MMVEFRWWRKILNSNRMVLHVIGVFHLGFLFVCILVRRWRFFWDLVAPYVGQELNIKTGVLGEGLFRKILWHFQNNYMNFTYHRAQLDFIGRLVNVKHHIGRNFAPCISVHSFHSSSAYIVQACLFLSKLGWVISTYMLDRICPLVGIGLRWYQNLKFVNLR